MRIKVKAPKGFKYRIIVCNTKGKCVYADIPSGEIFLPIAQEIFTKLRSREKDGSRRDRD